MSLSCQRCSGTNNGPQAFLLTCQGCSKTWHHRCHMPPVEDEHLIQRIRATNAGDKANGLEAWICRRCKKAALQKISSATSSREPTASLADDTKSLQSSCGPDAGTDAGRASSTMDVRTKAVPGNVVGAPLTNVGESLAHEGRDRRDRTEKSLVKHTLLAKRTKSSAAHQPYVRPRRPSPTQQPRDADAPTTQEKSQRPAFPSHQDKSARQSVSSASAMVTDDDVDMDVDSVQPMSIESTSRSTSRASLVQAPPSDRTVRPQPIVDVPPHVRGVSFNEKPEPEVRPADGATVQPQLHQNTTDEIDDDPDDLYGPPVERRIIRILPSLAEELREQQRHAAAEKERQRAPLAPDWIIARHAWDPLWKDIPTEKRSQRKVTARQLGDNGLNVNELMKCWVRPHRKHA